MMALGLRDGTQHLRRLVGIRYDASTVISGEDPLSEMISQLPSLEELEVVGFGDDDSTSDPTRFMNMDTYTRPLNLPRLLTLTMLSMPTSPLLDRLIHSSLPLLRNVIITSYGDTPPPFSQVNTFLSTHGHKLLSVVFHTPQSWPIVRFPPPTTLLQFTPKLRALSLESTGLTLVPPLATSDNFSHPLESIWISRPTSGLLDELLRILNYLPKLKDIRARDVRWAKKGMSVEARRAGFQGEMGSWARILKQRGIRMMDADGLLEGTV
jgi:hypothetical protein